jgi:hypothetical protein
VSGPKSRHSPAHHPSFRDFHAESKKLRAEIGTYMENMKAETVEMGASEHREASSQDGEGADCQTGDAD